MNKVNEASAFDQITGQEPGAFLLPKIRIKDDDPSDTGAWEKVVHDLAGMQDCYIVAIVG